MGNKRIRDIEGYEAFKAECSFFKCDEEYPGWVGTEKYGIITGLSKEELEARFPQFIKAMSPYVLLDLEYGRIRAEAKRNDDKFDKRAKRNHSFFELDEEAEAMYPELSVSDFVTEMIEEQETRTNKEKNKIGCCWVLSQLTEVQKKRLVMRHIQKKTFDEIALDEGCTQEAVIKSIKNAEKKFRFLFETGLVFDTPNSMHYEGVNSILARIAASKNEN